MNCIKEKKVLVEIHRIARGPSSSSMQAARKFYKIDVLSELVSNYFLRDRKASKSSAAKSLEMSVTSLDKIIRGSDISENMLFRLKTYFEKQVEGPTTEIEDLFNQSWRYTDSETVQNAISEVAKSLTKLLKILHDSNQLGDPDSAIGPLQRAQLVALLETMLVYLKAPFVKEKHVDGVVSWMRRLLGNALKKGVEKYVSDALSEAVEKGEQLVSELEHFPIIQKRILNF